MSVARVPRKDREASRRRRRILAAGGVAAILRFVDRYRVVRGAD